MHTFVCHGLPKTADDPSGMVETIKTERWIEHIKKCNFHIYRMVLTVRPTLQPQRPNRDPLWSKTKRNHARMKRSR